MNTFWNLKNLDSPSPELVIEGAIKIEPDLMDLLLGKDVATSRGLVSAIRAAGARPLTVWVDSPGGDVMAGTAIYTALCEQRERFGCKITIKVANAISAAHVLSMAGDTVLWSPVALGMMHNPYTRVEGDAKDLARGITVLGNVKDVLVEAYVRKTGKSRQEVSSMMDAETWMTAQQAVEWGFADGLLYDQETPAPVIPENVRDYLAGVRRIYNYMSLNKQPPAVLAGAQRDRTCAQDRLKLEKMRYGGN